MISWVKLRVPAPLGMSGVIFVLGVPVMAGRSMQQQIDALSIIA